ncbi:MAG TPA: RNA 2',3'-cyclic phosphodiesterase [Sphingomonadales bacterium]|nr:RNA 2',3'-cyclic phosphodiesterase [Sphingomonadales bacterium]
MIRLFTGITLPENVKATLLAAMGGLPHIRWQTRAQLHLTLRFIGNVEPSLALDIRYKLAAVKFSPFSFAIRGLGIFGAERTPRMLWAAVEGGEPLRELYKRISASLNGLGIEPETRKYTPHVTLGRFKGSRGERLSTYLARAGALSLPAVPVEEFALFQSHPGNDGSHYEIIETYS